MVCEGSGRAAVKFLRFEESDMREELKRDCKKYWRTMSLPVFVFFVLLLVGTVDVAILYYLGESTARHSHVRVGLLAVVKAVTWALPFTAVSFLLNKRWKWISLLLTFPILIVAIEVYARLNFNRGLGGEWYTLLVTSSTEEMGDFIRAMLTLPNAVFISIVFLILAGVVAFLFYCKPLPEATPLSFRFSFCLIIFILFAILKFCITIGADCTYPYFIRNTLRNRNEFLSLRQCLDPAPINEFFLMNTNDANPVVMIVIGESACRSHWSAYGYLRETTPCVDAIPRDNKAMFYDVQAPYPVTTTAMRCLVTDATIEHLDITCTLPYVMRQCGYRSVLISNQGHWSGTSSYESMLFASCDERIYISDLGLPQPIYDEAILSVVERELQNTMGGKVIFVHLMGSHTPMDIRYPKSREVFSLGSVPLQDTKFSPSVCRTINAYDNSIAYTDYILGKLIRMLRSTNHAASLLYLSDHGESTRSESWRDISDPDCWEIPMFVWWDDRYQNLFPQIVKALKSKEKCRLQTDWLFYGILGLCGITGDYDHTLSFLSEDFSGVKKRRFERNAR